LLSLIKKYRHGFLIAGYAVIYLMLFIALENRPVSSYHVIHTAFDDMIPFCEFFIIPYMLWFPYMLFTVCYFIFRRGDHREYYQLCFNLMMGMTVFLVVSWLYPNMQQLRPYVFPRENIFTDAVRILYQKDTPTNILPSIHVFNSLAIHMAISSSEKLRNKKVLRMCSLVLTSLIILSTMFLKQHSLIDVSIGMAMALFGYEVFYAPGTEYKRKRIPALSSTTPPAHKSAR